MDGLTRCPTCGAFCEDGKPIGDETLTALMDSVSLIYPSSYIRNLEIDTRSKHALQNGDIDTMSALLSKTKKQLLDIRGMGKSSVRSIEAALAKRGLKLAKTSAA